MCSMWRMLLPCGKLIGLLLFCIFFLISILFLKPNIRTLNTSRTELARLVMGTIFLVVTLTCRTHAFHFMFPKYTE